MTTNINKLLHRAFLFYFRFIRGFHLIDHNPTRFHNSGLLNRSILKPASWKYSSCTNIKSISKCFVRASDLVNLGEGGHTANIAFGSLVKRTECTEDFNLRYLDGCTASKGFHWSKLDCKKSMDEVGAAFEERWVEKTFNSSDDVIKQCIEWPEARLSDGVTILYPCSYNKSFWLNSGGSHHMAYLCHHLNTINSDLYIKANIIRDEIVIEGLDNLDPNIKVYVVSASECFYRSIFNRSPVSQLSNSELLTGAYTDSRTLNFCGEWQLIVFNRNAVHSNATKTFLNELYYQGRALPLEKFLMQLHEA